MTDLIAISSRVIDEGLEQVGSDPFNRMNNELSEIADGIAMVEAFSHCVLFETGEGLVGFDTSNDFSGPRVVQAIRGWRSDPFHSLVYTHGHLDHVGGSGHFVAEAERSGHARPSFVGHENVLPRFDRYDLTAGYNVTINERQFGRPFRDDGHFLPPERATPDVTYRESMDLTVGDTTFELRHAIGETDDHTWAWVPEHRAICAGDFFIWRFPNAGNPQKVQRFPLEWAAALREMAAMDAELFLPAHGLPIAGQERINRVLTTTADVLEKLVSDTLALMNDGVALNEIVHTVKVSDEALGLPWLFPFYDEPEFVINNIWRLYGGWYDGNPSHLKPASDAALGGAVAALAGGASSLAERAAEMAASGEADDLRTACHLIEFAVNALGSGTDVAATRTVHGIRSDIYKTRRGLETSLMAQGIYGHAERMSATEAEQAKDE